MSRGVLFILWCLLSGAAPDVLTVKSHAAASAPVGRPGSLVSNPSLLSKRKLLLIDSDTNAPESATEQSAEQSASEYEADYEDYEEDDDSEDVDEDAECDLQQENVDL